VSLPGAPDLIRPVAAFRTWRIVDGRLCSPYVDVAWTEPVQRAVCRRPAGVHHAAPDPRCGCGIYAYHRLVPELAGTFAAPGTALGIVTVWGSIEAYRDGLRAEFAEVRALAFRRGWGGRFNGDRRRVADDLGADLVDYTELEDAALHYGGPLPEALCP
jgi:hypothetical protein